MTVAILMRSAEARWNDTGQRGSYGRTWRGVSFAKCANKRAIEQGLLLYVCNNTEAKKNMAHQHSTSGSLQLIIDNIHVPVRQHGSCACREAHAN